jgi:RNA polymerase sigma-70 factor (ECF subfamily)
MNMAEARMSADHRLELERELRARVEAGELERATTLAITSYGPELLGYLQAMSRDDDLASEAFAIACEQLWKHLARFRWDASLRTWLYQVARNALTRLRRMPGQRAERNIPLSLVTSIAEVQRQSTAIHQRTESKNALRELRESLSPDDHELLLLRLDRGMAWKDIARATSDEELGAAALTARAAMLRKRYERVKAELREKAIAAGLFEG